MQLSLEKLQKIFRLEAERGFDNRAVVGGLEKILVSWEAQARVDNLPDSAIQSVISQLKNYPQLEPEARGEALRKIWRLLQITREENPEALAYPPKNGNPSNSPINPDQHPVRDGHPSPDPRRDIRKSRPKQRFQENQPADQLRQRNNNPPPLSTAVPTQGDLPSERGSTPVQTRPTNPPPPRDRQPANNPVGENAPLTVINGIGPRHAATLSNLNLNTLGDLLYFFPRRYDDFSQLKTINNLKFGEEVTVIASVQSTSTRPVHGGKTQLSEAVVTDGTGSMRLIWFNQPWQINHLRTGSPVTVSGKVEQFLGRSVMNNPECETLDQEQLHTNRIVPIYPLTAHVTQHWLRRIMHQTISYWAPRIPDFLPSSIRKSAGLVDLPTALLQAHFPSSQEQLKAARERLAFDEIFLLQLGVMRQKRAWHSAAAQVYSVPDEWIEGQVGRLPFQLTQAQQHALSDLRKDFASGSPMNRLLQGDVGSGKTVIAALGIAMVAHLGAQSALMAPTSILADQHYRSMLRLLSSAGGKEDAPLSPDQIRLMVGDTPEPEKQEIRAGLESGAIKLVIGTHALIEAPVMFSRLQFIVVDEQHRFGVQQRGLLRAKGENPHLLVMTATPIPRSLALTVYGDLDLTVMDELPAGRQVIETHVLAPRERERAYTIIRSQIEQQHQAFIIYPLVEQGDNEEARAAVEEHARLQQEIFPGQKIGLLHGRMKPEEKDEVMAHFRDGDYHILVSTSVVEVGVDVPNASVMLVEGANRFGLAQLHQFRGRVGRGEAKSICLLIPETIDDVENERLRVMTETNNGFVLAERDLDQRGPGEFLGTRQSGYAELKMATLTDIHMIEKARDQAQTLFELDPELESPENQMLSENFQRFWSSRQGDIS